MRPLALALCFSVALTAFAADPAKPADADGWVELLKTGSDSPWLKVDAGWKFATGDCARQGPAEATGRDRHGRCLGERYDRSAAQSRDPEAVQGRGDPCRVSSG